MSGLFEDRAWAPAGPGYLRATIPPRDPPPGCESAHDGVTREPFRTGDTILRRTDGTQCISETTIEGQARRPPVLGLRPTGNTWPFLSSGTTALPEPIVRVSSTANYRWFLNIPDDFRSDYIIRPGRFKNDAFITYLESLYPTGPVGYFLDRFEEDPLNPLEFDIRLLHALLDYVREAPGENVVEIEALSMVGTNDDREDIRDYAQQGDGPNNKTFLVWAGTPEMNGVDGTAVDGHPRRIFHQSKGDNDYFQGVWRMQAPDEDDDDLYLINALSAARSPTVYHYIKGLPHICPDEARVDLWAMGRIFDYLRAGPPSRSVFLYQRDTEYTGDDKAQREKDEGFWVWSAPLAPVHEYDELIEYELPANPVKFVTEDGTNVEGIPFGSTSPEW